MSSPSASYPGTSNIHNEQSLNRGGVPDERPTFKVYKPASSQQPSLISSLEALPDSYFTPTAADLQAAQTALSARTQALVNAPLQLRATREAAERAKHNRWPNVHTTTIRIRFTDRTQLEKIFPSTDKIRSVYAFVRSLLREDIKPIKFILYQSPPKRDFKVSDPLVRDRTLSELNLAPSSILLLRFEDESLNHVNVPAPLASSVLAQAIDLPSPPDYDSQISAPQPSQTSSTPKIPSTEKKIPKWLKMGLKK